MDLYQELILEHSKRPHGRGLREPFDAEVSHVNPTCGDEVTLRVTISGEGAEAVVRDVSYQAQGCSISVAGSSVLAQEVTGHRVVEALETFVAMRSMLTSRGTEPGDAEVIGDGVAFAGVSKYPARVKCALLGWTAFTDALARAGVDISAASTSATNTSPTGSTSTSTRTTNAASTSSGSTATQGVSS